MRITWVINYFFVRTNRAIRSVIHPEFNNKRKGKLLTDSVLFSWCEFLHADGFSLQLFNRNVFISIFFYRTCQQSLLERWGGGITEKIVLRNLKNFETFSSKGIIDHPINPQRPTCLLHPSSTSRNACSSDSTCQKHQNGDSFITTGKLCYLNYLSIP